MSEIELKPIECTNCGYTNTPSPLNVDKFGLVRCPICGKSDFVEYDFVDETSKEKRIDDQAEVLYGGPRRGGEQIEELRLNIQDAVGGCSPYWSRLIAEKLFGLGYRKQSEWISVEERLPEDKQICLVYGTAYYVPEETESEEIFTTAFYKEFGFVEQIHAHITHWMPLPEPPKGGGE